MVKVWFSVTVSEHKTHKSPLKWFHSIGISEANAFRTKSNVTSNLITLVINHYGSFLRLID